LRAEDAACGGHGGLGFRRKGITMGSGAAQRQEIDAGLLV
jgi:hypothetical protein